MRVKHMVHVCIMDVIANNSRPTVSKNKESVSEIAKHKDMLYRNCPRLEEFESLFVYIGTLLCKLNTILWSLFGSSG